MGNKGGGTTTTRNEIPPELQALYSDSAYRIRDAQARSPISDFYGQGNAFRTAPRADQFGQAQRGIAESQRIAGQTPASRQLLNQQPVGTQNAQIAAQQALSQSGQIPGQYSQLTPVAQRQVGIQGLEQSAVNRVGGIAGQVGQTPGRFGQTRQEFQAGVDPLQQYASRVPGQYQGTLEQFQAGIGPLQQQAGQVPGTFGDVRNQADPRLANLINQSDRQVTGQNIQASPSYQAANQAFEAAILPQVQSSAQQAGLGRSTGLQQSLAQAQAQYLLPVVQGELAREERGIDRGLGARRFGIQTAADLGLQEALAQERGIQRGTDIGQFGLATEANLGIQGAQGQERGIERGTNIGQFGLATSADLGLQQALGQERALGRAGQAEQFASGLEANIGQLLAGRQENQIGRELAALTQQGQAGERAIDRGQAASQFLANQYQAAGQQDLQRALEGLGADERSRALRYDQSQNAFGQLTQLGQLEQDYNQAGLDRNTQDFLRRQALSEQALYQPFGLIAPSAIGQSASTSGGKKGK